MTEELPKVWGGRFQDYYGVLRNVVLETLDKYLNCGLLAHGVARAECELCKKSTIIPFSCKTRGLCVSCAAKRALIFAEVVDSQILAEENHHHVIFTIPKRVRAYFRYERKLCSLLFNAAWEAIKESMPDVTPGAVGSLQTSGENLNFNPHIHKIVSSGGFNEKGEFVEHKLDDKKLTRLFMAGVLQSLKGLGLIEDSLIEQLESQEHSGFGVWVGEAIKPQDAAYRLFLARYIDRGPVTNSKLSVTDSGKVALKTKNGEVLTWEPVEFLARLTAQVPNKWEQTNRFFGYYSHRSRGKRRLEQKEKEGRATQFSEPKPKPSRTWAFLIKKVFEVNPLSCLHCGGTMQIKAFITNPKEVARLLQNLQIPGFTKPEPIRGPPQPEFESQYT